MLTSLFAIGSLISVSHRSPGAHPVSDPDRCSPPPFPTLSCTSVSITRWADVRTGGSCNGGVVLILSQCIATRCSGHSTYARQFAGELTTTLVYLCVVSETRPLGPRITAGYVHVPLVPRSYLSYPWPRIFASRPRLCNSSRARSPAVAMGARYSLSRAPIRGPSKMNTISSPGKGGT